MRVTRRQFVGTASAAAVTLAAATPLAAPTYKRSLVTSPDGQRALASYARGVQAMLDLPPDHPHNWFRNAFVHLMDCPHGNWWFYVWHRGYLGHFEEIIRTLSGDSNFALPYWDWTQLPRLPDGTFDNVLSPTNPAFTPYTQTLGAFTSYFKPSFTNYCWRGLSSAQRYQLRQRGCAVLQDLWKDVTGNGTPAYMSFATRSRARYLSKRNPYLDRDTTYAVSSDTVRAGLEAPRFNDPDGSISFTSQKAASHNAFVDDTTVFSILEGTPHNMVHNCVGGMGAIDPGPYGWMVNFLSPVDPIFFLHHANMDRLWDVWMRRQIAMQRPYRPDPSDAAAFYGEPFLFFVDANANPVSAKAGDYFYRSRFNYFYDRLGFGEDLVRPSSAKSGVGASANEPIAPSATRIVGNTAVVAVPAAMMPQNRLGAEQRRSLVATFTLERPVGVRQFRVFVGAPDDADDLGPDSPYYAGAIGFFGAPMTGMPAPARATFSVPLRSAIPTFAERLTSTTAPKDLKIRVVPVNGGKGAAPVLRAVSIRSV